MYDRRRMKAFTKGGRWLRLHGRTRCPFHRIAHPEIILLRSDGSQSLLHALLNRLVSIDRRFGIGNRLETGLHFQVEREGSVMRRVRRIGFKIQTTASGFIGTGTLDDRPGLAEFTGEFENTIDLVAAGEGTAV